MTSELSDFAARWRDRFFVGDDERSLHSNARQNEPPYVGCYQDFNSLALELFALQFKYNAAYQKICQVRRLTPETVEDWTQISAVPTAAFKELELSCLPPEERTVVFHSSGTTEQWPSRHYHNSESLSVYETSLWQWFLDNVLPDLRFTIYDLRSENKSAIGNRQSAIFLTPPPAQAPHSSLVHMFETIRSRAGKNADRSFYGRVATDGSWVLDFDAVLAALNSSLVTRHPSLLMGTAFSLVHLLDYLVERDLLFRLPPGSRVMETGGYKNRSRTMPKPELHALITERLGVPAENIICEYGMSELSSQAYDRVMYGSVLPHPGPLPRERENCRPPAGETLAAGNSKGRTLLFPLPAGEGQGEGKRTVNPRIFRFPPWARVRVVSPETGCEVADGETGLIRVFDLANVFSVLAVQTEDLAIRRGDGFELIGRAALAEARGCSLMSN